MVEMLGMYLDGEYDLVGFVVGVVEKSKIIDGSMIVEGDVVFGFVLSGIYLNGFLFVCKIIECVNFDLLVDFYGCLFVDVLMVFMCIYVKLLFVLM